MKTCPVCRQSWPWRRRTPRTLARLERIGGEWTQIYVGSSRWHVHKLSRRFPGWEFRAYRISLITGDGATYRIDARRRDSEKAGSLT